MTPNTMTDEAEAVEAQPLESSTFWQRQIELAKRDHKDFWDYGAKVEKRYKAQRDNVAKARTGKRMAILYSNSETLRAALYARTAKPDVRQRFTQKKDPLSRTAGDMLERSLSYCGDTTEHDRAFRKGVQDLVIPGRGVVRVVYEPAVTMGPDGQEVIADQKVDDEFVYYRNFLHSPAECWKEVWWVAFKKLMTRDDMKAARFEDWETIPLNWAPDLDGAKDRDIPDELKRAEVWEVWDKSKKRRVWVVEGHPTLCRQDEDPYQLQGFWPMAEPCQAISGNDNFVPCAYFTQYEDQADDLDEIVNRISKLTAALKRRGIYDASVKELRRLAKAADNEFIPSDNFAAFASAGGLKGAFQTEDLKPIAEALIGLYQQRDQLIQSIYEITGISDIMRGSTDAGETLGAQQLKAQFGSARVKTSQQDVQRWIRDTLRIKAELIAEHFEPHVLMAMSGLELPSQAQVEAEYAQQQMAMAQQALAQGQIPGPPPPPPQTITIDAVVQLLRDDKLRSYRIDIETDSTIFEDAETEKESRTELLTAMFGFMQNWLPVVKAGGPPMMKLGFEMLEFGVRGFKSGRQLEEALEEARTNIEQAAANPEPPPPDPKVEGEKIKLEATKMKAEADVAKTQMDMQKSVTEHQMDMEKLMFQAANPMPMNGAGNEFPA